MGLLQAAKALVLPNRGLIVPQVINLAEGFEVSIERKEGVLLTSTPKDEPDAEPKDASVDYYFEVSVRPDGSNPEYPAQDEPSKYRYTVLSEQKGAYGLMGGTKYIPAGARWTHFELVEEFDEAKQPPIGKWMPPHHHVSLRAHYQEADGKQNSMSGSSWVRKSERESTEWQMAAMSPVTYC